MQGKSESLDVTALIPAYNRAGMIERAIRSVQAQHPAPPAELIVVDDASTDGTGDIAERLGARVIRHDRNQGPSGARNTGIAAAAHSWIALLDSDDEWLPGHLGNLWQMRGDHVLVADSAIHVGADRTRWQGAATRAPIVLRSPGQLLFPENFVTHSSVLLRTGALRAAGGYTPGMSHVQDLDLLVRVLEHGSGLVVPDLGAIYHGHDDQRSLDRVHMRSVHREVIARYAERSWWDPRLIRSWDGACAWDDARLYWREGRRGASARRLSALLGDPRKLAAVVRMLVWRWRGRRRVSEHSPLPA